MAKTAFLPRVVNPAEDHVVDRNAEETKTDHQHAGNGARLEGHRQRRLKTTGPRGVRRPHIGPDGDVHPDIARSARQHSTDHEADGRENVKQK